MAELIDITDFGGVVTNVDVEDLPEHIAQNMENLRIRDGKLEKTFGAGQPSSVPNFALSELNTKLSKSYVVYNVFTFISDKFTTNEYRYILVLIDSSTKEVLLFWYDPSQPAVSDHLQIEDNILIFETASDSGHAQSANVMVVDVKDNSGSAIAGTDIYDDIDYKSGNKHYVNTDSASTWGGSFFATALDTGCRENPLGGKHTTHLALTTNASNNTESFKNMALLALNGKVLCMYSYLSGSAPRIKTTVGSTPVALTTSDYSDYIDTNEYTSMSVASMITFNNAIYVHYSGVVNGSSAIYNAIHKYTVASNGTISEEQVNDGFLSASTTPSASASVSKSYFYILETGTCYLLIPGSGLWKMDTTDSAFSVVSGTPSNTTDYSWIGMTSITNTVSGTANYLVLAERRSSIFKHKLHYGIYNALTGNFTWTDSGVLDNDLHFIDKMDFGENSNKNESLVINVEKADTTKYVQYSTANDSNIVLAWADLSSTYFTTSTVITFIKHSYKNPNGTKYLYIGTNDSTAGSPAVMTHGRVYRIDVSKSVSPINDNANDSYKGWNPTCFDDVITGFSSGNYFFTHAKAYIGAYGVEYTSLADSPSSALNRFTDIGWGSGSWNGTGTVDYKWTNLNDKYTFPEISETNVSSTSTIYHNTDKNPIVPTNDTLRFIPGAIGRVSNTEAKSLWLGYISRTLFNNTVTIPSDWYGYVNTLNNPFSLTEKRRYKTNNPLRAGDTVKYNCTAVYDGVQETLFDKNDELIFSEGAEVQKYIFELNITIPDITLLNKRITGVNIYRAIGTSGSYSNWQLIGHMTFVDSGNDLSSVGSLKNVTIMGFADNVVIAKSDNHTAIAQSSYSESLFGTNSKAIGVDGGWDGIDGATATPLGTLPYVYYTTARQMSQAQKYIVLPSTTGLVAGGTLVVEDEILNIGGTITPGSMNEDTGYNTDSAVTWSSGQTGVSVIIDHSDGDVSNVFRVGDKISIASSSGLLEITAIGYNSSTTETTLTVKNTNATGGTSVNGDIMMREIATGGIYVDIQTRAYESTTAVAHPNNANVGRASSPDYVGFYLDDDADLGNSYLDASGSFVGSAWQVEKRLTGGRYTDISGYGGTSGAYSGNYIGILFPNNISEFSDNITVNQLVGSMVFRGEGSFEIEANGAYDADIGGCWIKVSESFGVSAGSSVNKSQFVGELLEGFGISTAQGSTTPGMGFAKDSNKITITCRDYRLEDLGESPNQTIYSNRVNGQYAKQLKGRLFLGNIYLNPEDKSEEHSDWIAYSELNQFDTIPVSNVISFDDREGGDVTGLGVLFSRLVIFKPQAIFVLNVTDPISPSSWSVAESKHNIGNVATQGVVEVHDSIYFVYHDGIYRLSSNTIASSTATPSVMDKVSDPIDDQFQLASDKTAIIGIFDPARQEIIYKWLEGSDQKVWGYNYVKKSWRKIDMGTGVINMLNYDENGRPLNYDRTNNKIIKFDTANASISKWKSKRFPLDLHRKRLLRYGTVQFVGTDTLTYNLYLDGAGSASFTKSITADGGIVRFPIKRYAKKFEIELSTASSTNAFTLERLQIEME